MAFVADLVQQVNKTYIQWKLHTAYRPQSSGMVEGANWTLKETLSKWIIETWCSVLLKKPGSNRPKVSRLGIGWAAFPGKATFPPPV